MTDLENGSILFGAISLAAFGMVGFGLRTGKTLGIAFRSRLVARRHDTPILYWASLSIFAAVGVIAAIVVVNNAISSG